MGSKWTKLNKPTLSQRGERNSFDTHGALGIIERKDPVIPNPLGFDLYT